MALSLAAARAIIAKAQELAAGVGKPMSITVVDAGGYTILTERMDGARPLTPSIALSKAHTSAVMQRPSALLKPWCKASPEFFAQLSNMSLYPIVATDGGFTIRKDDEILGGLGISGGSPEEDQELCEKTLEALGYDLAFENFARIK